jgi:hypothetical protein
LVKIPVVALYVAEIVPMELEGSTVSNITVVSLPVVVRMFAEA